MDINLHSFILVLGLIVILFIVIDGIKKVREARSNHFDEDVLDGDLLASEDPSIYHEEGSFCELEIADDLVNRSFVDDESDNREQVHLSDPVDNTADSHSDALDREVDSEEHFQSLDGKMETDSIDDPLYSSDMNSDSDTLESFSVDSGLVEEVEEPILAPQGKAKVQPRKIHSDQPSKSEVESRRNEIQAAQTPEMHHAPLENIPETVPVLMEPVELGGEVDPNPPLQQEMVLPEFVQQTLQDEPIIATKTEPGLESLSIDDVGGYTKELDASQASDVQSNTYETKKRLPVGERLEERPPAEEIFVINVLKENGPLLSGAELHHIFNACDMRHGEMDIFHRFEKENAQGKIQFSVVNALKPGTFDLNSIDEMETKGISMFMSLPGPEDPMAAFDAMAEVGLVFARNFSASLYDESHSDLTPQTLEHYRNRIREYSRKQFSKK
jgi:cell division protein ZipA